MINKVQKRILRPVSKSFPHGIGISRIHGKIKWSFSCCTMFIICSCLIKLLLNKSKWWTLVRRRKIVKFKKNSRLHLHLSLLCPGAPEKMCSQARKLSWASWICQKKATSGWNILFFQLSCHLNKFAKISLYLKIKIINQIWIFYIDAFIFACAHQCVYSTFLLSWKTQW